MSPPPFSRYIGLMSGTSLDGTDAVLAEFGAEGACLLCVTNHQPFDQDLRDALLALNSPGSDEIARSCLLANALARHYAGSVQALLRDAGISRHQISAIGMHGQTVRHRPELGYTVQIGNAALLAELAGIPVVADFRSRDVAAGGQGAPLVPAFHRAVFATPGVHRVIVNVGGISNLTDLAADGAAGGFDCGPGNLLMDGWIRLHLGQAYDRDGTWAAGGAVIPELLTAMLAHPFFGQSPPKSTGRDSFYLDWVRQLVRPGMGARDVQATLLELSARCIADAILRYCASAGEIYLCGGGAHNLALLQRLRTLLPKRNVETTDRLGIAAEWVEAAAFAWLARQTLLGLPGSLPEVTGASGPRVLGAIYPASWMLAPPSVSP